MGAGCCSGAPIKDLEAPTIKQSTGTFSTKVADHKNADDLSHSAYPETIEEMLPGVEQPSTDDCPYPPNYAPPISTSICGTYSTHGLMPQPWGLPPVKVNQDFGTVLYPCSTADQIVFTVFDGHGRNGERASQTAANMVNLQMEKGMASPQVDVPQLLASSIRNAHDALDGHVNRKDFLTSGTTAVVVAIRGQEMWVANVGDSRAVIGLEGGRALGLTKDHKANDPEEKQRIMSQGGLVIETEGEAARVVAIDEHGTKFALGMSRSLGDLRFVSTGVSHDADIQSHTLSAEDKWLVVATDGIWEFIERQEAIDIVRASWEQHQDATMACRALIARAKQLWFEVEGDYRDDITVSVVDLQRLLAHMKEQSDLGDDAVPNSPAHASPSEGVLPPAGETARPSVPPGEPSSAHKDQKTEVAYRVDADAFLRRRASVVPGSIPEGGYQLDTLPDSKASVVKAAAERRASISPEMDMKLWPSQGDGEPAP